MGGTRRLFAAITLTVLVAFAGCSAVLGGDGAGTTPSAETTGPATTAGGDETTTADGDGTTTADGDGTTTTATPEPYADPANDTLGWEDGYWWDEPIDVDGSDGLTPAELEPFTARALARIERIRGLEFEATPTVEIREARTAESRDLTARYKSRAFWEATFLVDDLENAKLHTVGRDGVGAFVDDTDSVVVFQHRTDRFVLGTEILVHEFTHNLQRQHSLRTHSSETTDEQIAAEAMREAEASYVQRVYERRCIEDEWSCVDGLRFDDAIDLDLSENGIKPEGVGVWFLTHSQYGQGEEFVGALVERGGWGLVERAYDDVASTEQLIHPGHYPEDDPVAVTVDDRSGEAWAPEEYAAVPVTDRVGQAGIVAMFVRNGVIPASAAFTNDTLGQTTSNYSHAVSDGWEGDRLVPYTNGSATGYVWRIRWESAGDAEEFAAAYRRLLDGRDAERVREGVYRIPADEPFADAFRVDVSGDTVTIVNAPRVPDLSGIYPPA